MKYLLTVACVAALTFGCGGGERVGGTSHQAEPEAEVAASEAIADDDEAQGGGERVGGNTSGGTDTSMDAGDASMDADDDEAQGGGERVGGNTSGGTDGSVEAPADPE